MIHSLVEIKYHFVVSLFYNYFVGRTSTSSTRITRHYEIFTVSFTAPCKKIYKNGPKETK